MDIKQTVESLISKIGGDGEITVLGGNVSVKSGVTVAPGERIEPKTVVCGEGK